jgi:hypothetical protein
MKSCKGDSPAYFTPGWIGLGGVFALVASVGIAWAREVASVMPTVQALIDT